MPCPLDNVQFMVFLPLRAAIYGAFPDLVNINLLYICRHIEANNFDYGQKTPNELPMVACT